PPFQQNIILPQLLINLKIKDISEDLHSLDWSLKSQVGRSSMEARMVSSTQLQVRRAERD
ncbi:hypothetical protein LINPERPRIM_LOCUS4786, partial [Linum perenne]